MSDGLKAAVVHGAVLALLAAAPSFVSDYAQLSLTRIMVLAVYASGYNLLYGYAGLLSLGHAMLFAVGLYSAALGTTRLGLPVAEAFLLAMVAGAAFAALVGALALRASGVSFMIVTLMFSQAAFLAVLYFGDVTRGDEGIVIPDAVRRASVFGWSLDLTDAAIRYRVALALLAAAMGVCAAIVHSRAGRVLAAIRENEARTAMLGYDVARHKLFAFVVSGTLSAAAGAAYALLFAFAGATLASIQYSINPLLWTLLGGAGTLLGPLVGTALMVTLVDVASGFTTANLLAVGVVLIASVLFFPQGVVGTLRTRLARWLP